MKTSRILAAALLAVGSGLALHAANAQQAGLHRTDLLQQDIGLPGREAIQVRVDFDGGAVSIKHSHPGEEVAYVLEGDGGAVSIKHSHPGEEVAYVLEGSLEYQLEGRAPVTLNAGEALFIPAGVAHVARNVGSGKASELATYIVEKGSPLVVPAE
ncbi:cupin domain-containing protein [Sinorhizobium medicae]|uniref:cupin domain-containing protein n=1 Tax=Sinorhizobium medicae TaxID=110321 RepID=UPI000C7BEABC|nr:cupin domain-containing protein [Sinorhizobium medicae]PLT96926.1 cupin [Sinorhizobium medicae]